ncbi:MAG TPA: nuclear transport factor 2 family protein [Gemmatimonadales bacterium]|jgi:ketosteroid isomerase-like protein
MTRTLLRALPWALLVAACRTGAPPTDDPALAGRLTAQLLRSADDWNRGDLEGFMSDYARDSTTSFVEGGHVRRGWDYIHSRYAPRFGPGAQRDSLRFEEVAVRSLGTDHALLTARFVLFRGGQTSASGPFSLILERQTAGWKILHDHTSSDPR